MVFAMAQESLDFLGRLYAQGLGVPGVECQAIIALPVGEKHGRLSFNCAASALYAETALDRRRRILYGHPNISMIVLLRGIASEGHRR